MVATYFMKISQLKDQLKAIGDTVIDDELLTIALNGFALSWDPNIKGYVPKISYRSLNNYGTIVSKRKQDSCRSKACRSLQRMGHEPLHQMQRRERGPSTKDLSAVKDQSMLMVMSARKKTFPKSNALIVTNTDTVLLSVLAIRRKEEEGGMWPLPKMYLKRKQRRMNLKT